MPCSSRSPTERSTGYGLPRSSRLLQHREFRRVYSRGRRARGRAIIVVALARRAPGHRLGVSVSKDHGRAIRRNKIKRLLREAFRLERPTLPGRFDLVLIPQQREGKYALDELRAELRKLVVELAGRADRPERRGRRRGRRRRQEAP
jgi:ribonuclease P protein component